MLEIELGELCWGRVRSFCAFFGECLGEHDLKRSDNRVGGLGSLGEA